MIDSDDALEGLCEPVRAWFVAAFPAGPTPPQAAGWPAIAAGEHLLLTSPTGTGKTLAGFLAIMDRLIREHVAGGLKPGLRCVYVSPLRSLGYDVEKNLSVPLLGMRRALGLAESPIRIGTRTGDTSAYQRRTLRDEPPHVLITTPESLSLMLSQSAWAGHWRGVEHLIVDEVHALAATKRGADLAISLERLADAAERDPARLGLSATCRPSDPVARFLVGPSRSCRVIEAPPPPRSRAIEIEVESLTGPGEAPGRGLIHNRMIKRIRRATAEARTTIVFANSRPLAEKIARDLRRDPSAKFDGETDIAVHHSALDAAVRRDVEERLKAGTLRAVVTSTSLELGVDVGSADLTIQAGLPGGVARLVQRVGRSGHHVGGKARGLILAATAAEVVAAAVTARAATEGRIEPLRPIASPLDVVCQQLIGMACLGGTSIDAAFDLLRKAAPTADLDRGDFMACLDSLAGDLPAPAGAVEPEPGAPPRWTSPRIWKHGGRFGARSERVKRWFRTNAGTIHAEETATVIADEIAVGTVEAAYAERLAPGDRFVLDGRPLEFRRLDGPILRARRVGGDGSPPVWHSDRQALSTELAAELAAVRSEASRRSICDGPEALRGWFADALGLNPRAAAVAAELIEAQDRLSETPDADLLLVEEFPTPMEPGWTYAFHAPLNRSAGEALGRAAAARLGRKHGRDLAFQAADLGWIIRTLDDDVRFDQADFASIAGLENLEADVFEGVDRGELASRRFRRVASTALMVLRRPEPGKRVRVGGMNWVSTRLYPLVRAACPDHPLLRETRREILNDVLDLPAAARWLETAPTVRLRRLARPSPFALAWLTPGDPEPIRRDTPDDALRRLHARVMAAAARRDD